MARTMSVLVLLLAAGAFLSCTSAAGTTVTGEQMLSPSELFRLTRKAASWQSGLSES